MKVFGLICTILALVPGLKGNDCNLKPFVQGSCLELTDLYSYVENSNDCVFWQGCLMNGNHFSEKAECEAKCKQ
ncbi:BPTI/Kunitz domain-containing protein 4 [Drosophila santomea]|uniref:BPTI/Kunitz domain-containing protein 4 n=1 Tax=Drosophila santomea TaxID=129105 RepID=UPI001952C6C3|nr:BPTI/Kunitz domain-containing protein 4 [Drosophila santomea]